MSPELENAIAATRDAAEWAEAASDGPEGQEARVLILAAALNAAGVLRSDMPAPTPAPPALRVTITFPADAGSAATGAVLDAGRKAGARRGELTSDEAPSLIYTETYRDGEVVR